MTQLFKSITCYMLHVTAGPRSSSSKKSAHVRGFTLVELLVSIGILASMTFLSVRKFQLIQQDDALLSGAFRINDMLRKAQNYAQSGKRQDSLLAVGYGIHIDKSGSGGSVLGQALFFSDQNIHSDGQTILAGTWNGDVPDPQTGAKDQQIGDTLSPDPTGRKDISIDSITVGQVSGSSVDISFQTPAADALIDGSVAHDTVVITLKNKKNKRTKNVTFNRMSGRIDIGN